MKGSQHRHRDPAPAGELLDVRCARQPAAGVPADALEQNEERDRRAIQTEQIGQDA